MKRLTKIFKIGAVFLLAIAVVIGMVIFLSGPDLPDETDQIISSVMMAELPELLQGETGYVE